MRVNLQVIFSSSCIKLSSEAGDPLQGGGTVRKDVIGCPRSVPPRYSGCRLPCHIGQRSTSLATALTVRPPPAAPQEVKTRQLALNNSPEKKKLH